jgi:hypothetical protein
LISVGSEVQVFPGPPFVEDKWFLPLSSRAVALWTARRKVGNALCACEALLRGVCRRAIWTTRSLLASQGRTAVANRLAARPERDQRVRTRKWGCSSAGRAPALQAGGQRFDPAQLHHSGVVTSGVSMLRKILLEKTSLRFALWCEAPVLNHIVKRRHAGTVR